MKTRSNPLSSVVGGPSVKARLRPLTPFSRAALVGFCTLVLAVSAWRTQAQALLFDTNRPVCVSASAALTLSNITVRFSEAVDGGSAGDRFNYAVSGFDVISVETNADGMSATLSLDAPMSVGAAYQVTIQDVTDLSGNAISPNPCTLSFRAPVLSCGFLVFQVYPGQSTTDNNLDTTVLADPKYPAQPAATYYLPGFDSRFAYPDDSHEGYGGLIFGYFIPPVSGNWIFYTKSDDSSRLFLNPNGADAAGKQLMVEETACCGQFADHASAPQALTAGQQYYIEAIYKEGAGNDYFQAAAKLDADPSHPNTLRPIPGANLAAPADPTGATINITQQPADQVSVIQGGGGAGPQPVTFTVAATTSRQPVFYQWYRDNGSGFVPSPGANGSNYSILPVCSDNGARFRVQIYIPGAVVTSQTATLTAGPLNTPPRFALTPPPASSENAGPQTVPTTAHDIAPGTNQPSPTPIYDLTAAFDSLPPGGSIPNPGAPGAGNVAHVGDDGAGNSVLHLTDAGQNSSFGALVVDLPSTLNFQSFEARWKSRVGGGQGGGADGYSFNMGTDLPNPPDYGNPGEEGAGTGLSVTIDTFDNGTGLDVGVDIKWRGVRVAYAGMPKDNDGSGNFLRKDTFVDASLTVDARGLATANYDGNVITAQLPAYAGLQASKMEFGARTGGANDNQWIDNLTLRGFGAVPCDESGQAVRFLVSNNNPGLFANQPALSPDGTLTYTPAPGACGTAVVSVMAMDNGGTAFGGRDTSDPQTFPISIICLTPPTITCPPGVVAECTGGLTPVTFAVTAVDRSGAPVPVTCVPPSGTGFRLGTSNVTCTATASPGNSSSCSFTVMVVDTTPPRVTCPGDITIMPTNAAGTVVLYLASAFDACGLAGVNCSPPSGDIFPVGTTTVTCSTSDPSGNTNSCSFQVVLLGARGLKENVLAELIALRATVTDKEDGKKLDEAIEHLTQSLAAELWVDQTHLERKHGEKVFHEEKETVKKLCELIKRNDGLLPVPTLQGFIDRLFEADRLLASIAIDEAVAAGVARKKIEQARKDLAKGDQEAADDKCGNGMEDYEHAWKHAVHAKISPPRRLANGHQQLELLGEPAERLTLQVSTDLVGWTTLGTFTTDGEGVARYEDSDAGRFPVRFYRIVTP